MSSVEIKVNALIITKNNIQPIDWTDQLNVVLLNEYKIKITKKKGYKIATNHLNPIYQVADALQKQQHGKKGVSIEVIKNIPPFSGLSSQWNAAAKVMHYLNQEWGLELSQTELISIAQKIDPKLAHIVSASELKDDQELYVVILKPKFIEYPKTVLKKHALKHFADLKSIINTLKENGATESDLVASGPSIYAYFKNEADAKQARELFTGKIVDAWVGKTKPKQVY